MKIVKEIPASLDHLSTIEQVLEELYDSGKLSEEIFGNVIVAVTEAVLNAVNHGSKADPSKKVHFEMELTKKELSVVVKDTGKGFDLESLPDPTDPKNIEKGSGRGIFIMKNLSDEIAFEDGGATVKMTFLMPKKEVVGA